MINFFLFSESRYDDEVILKGNFKDNNPKHIEQYSLHKLHVSNEFDRSRDFNVISSVDMFMTKIQFERPFLYSTGTWVQGGCDKNLTQIVPSQSMYEEYGQPVEKPEKRREEGKFVYQILSKGALPHIKFHIPGKLKMCTYL